MGFVSNTTPVAPLQEPDPAVFSPPESLGWRTITEIFTGEERYHTHFFQRGLPVIAHAAFAATAALAIDKERAFDCDRLAQNINAVEKSEAGAAAPSIAAAQKQCGTC